MMLTKCWRWIKGNRKLSKRARCQPGCRPGVEPLEPRCLLSGTDVVFEWNAVAIEAAKRDYAIGAPGLQFGPTRTSRVLAIESIAVYDAVNAIDRSCAPFLVTDVHASAGASIEAAAAQAAYDTLSALYPDQQYPDLKPSLLNPTLAADLASIAPGPARQGIAVGHAVAQEVLADRANDGSQIDAVGQPNTYVYGNLPGQWRADPLHSDFPPLTPDWGKVTPFAVQSSSQFGAPPPPSITSKEYADAYEQVKAIGGDGVHTPTIRTPEQTVIGLFWGYDVQPGLCAPVRFYNQIAEVLSKQEGLTEIQNARFFALINVALGDAGITIWNDKYRYGFWRPVTAIRENDPGTGPTGLGSGNPYLVGQGDPNWQPLGAPADNHNGTNFTPPFPSYVSGHAGLGGALFGIMRDYFGTDNIHFTIVSDEFNTITIDQNGNPRPLIPRSFNSFSQAADENGQSRIYLGIHWEFDKVQGIKLGGEIADWVFGHFMAVRPNHSALGSHGGMATAAAPATAPASTNATPASTFLGSSLLGALTPSQPSGAQPSANQVTSPLPPTALVSTPSWSASTIGQADTKARPSGIHANIKDPVQNNSLDNQNILADPLKAPSIL